MFRRMTLPCPRAAAVLACCLFVVCAQQASSQRTLTLRQSLDIAVEKSYMARNARALLQASEASAQAARKALYSTVDLSFDVPEYSYSLNQQFNSVTNRQDFFQSENLRWSGAININQPLIWTNGTLTVSGVLYRLDQTNSSSSLVREFYTNVGVTLRQPLFVVNSQRNSLRRAEISYDEALADYRRSTLDLFYTVTESFYRSFSSQEQLRIQRDRVRQQEESFTTADRKYRSGLIAEVDALQFEVDLSSARNDVLSAENTCVSQANNFKILLGIPLRDSITLVLEDTTFHPVTLDVEKATAEAKRTRIELQRARNNVERAALNLDETESRRAIRGDLTLTYGLNNRDVELQTLYLHPLQARGVVMTVTVPVFDWGKHARDVDAAEAQLRSAEMTAENTELTIEQEITDLVRRIRSSAERVAVMFKSRQVAEKANDINTKRYEVGTIGSLELSQSQTRLLQARLGALEALIDYNVGVADLTRRTTFDFEKNAEAEVVR
jgi:outer membrane protein